MYLPGSFISSLILSYSFFELSEKFLSFLRASQAFWELRKFSKSSALYVSRYRENCSQNLIFPVVFYVRHLMSPIHLLTWLIYSKETRGGKCLWQHFNLLLFSYFMQTIFARSISFPTLAQLVVQYKNNFRSCLLNKKLQIQQKIK